jgi:hypothetical protein
MSAIGTKLKALQKKSAEKGHWQVATTAQVLLTAEDSLDAQINLIGSMHEVGLLSNSLDPYWKLWRATDENEANWINRCLQRLHSADADYWALAGLLSVRVEALKNSLSTHQYKLLSVRFANSYKDGQWQIGTFYLNYNPNLEQSRVIAPVLELGWSEGLIVEASRWRAVVLNEQKALPDGLAAQGSGSYFMRAKLPYGCWRIHDEPLELKEEWLVPLKDTPFCDYP